MQNIWILPLVAILIIPDLTNSYSGWIFDKKKPKCAELYSGPNFSQDRISVINPQVINDMSALTIESPKPKGRTETPENWDKRITSFRLYEGCKIKVCEGTHLDGVCESFNKSIPVIYSKWKDQISSIGCSCPIENCYKSRCSKIVLRQKDCGRAFLEPACQICGGQFVAIKKNHEQSNFGGYENKVKSLVVNKGCNLTYYLGNDFEEDEKVLGAGFYDDFDATLGSYQCYCSDAVTSPPVAPTIPNPDDPPLTEFAETDKGIQELAKRFPKHTGLDAALTSIRHRRSPKNAYILLIGLTGSGKSSTINFLFDNANITLVGSDTSTTHSINEYRIPVQVDELGCKNCELRVIDTPGFGDTSGLETDAKFLAGLETYLTHHEELRTRIPNVVLVFSKFSDNRFSGKSSSFVKTLRGIEYFQDKLFDTKYSNVITVLTHFMSESKKVKKNPAPKLRGFRQIIEDYTLFPKPVTIVVAENKPEDQDLVLVNGYYLLPNGEYYPQNLFEKIQEAAEKGQDPIGEAIIRTAFKAPENFKITEKIFPLKNVTFSREPFFLAELNARNFDIEHSEVSNITAKVFENQIPSHLKTTFPGNLQYVQRILNLRKIWTVGDIPRTTVETLKLFKNMRQNELIHQLLYKAFDLQVPSLDVPLLIGQCYNVLKDTILSETPYNTTVKKVSALGFKLPDIITSTPVNDRIDVFDIMDTKSDYARARLNHLKVDGSVKPELNAWEIRPGYNTLEAFKSKSDPKRRSITAVKEYRVFQLSLNTETAKLKPELLERIKSIPPFNERNHTIVDDWKKFFAKYGTHVVSSAFGGGAIQVEFKVKNESATVEQARAAIRETMTEFMTFLENVYLRKGLGKDDINTEHVQYTLRFSGGDFQYAVPDFSRLSISQTSTLLDGFSESLQYQPTMLQTSLSLIPLSVIAQKINPDYAYKISNATSALLNANLMYVPPPPPPPPLERPEVKKHIEDLKAKLQENIDKLNAEMKASRETFEKFTKEMERDNRLEIEKMKQQILKAKEDALKGAHLTCVYEQASLSGVQLCTAQQTNCIRITMRTVRSVNTHNSCVQFFKSQDCTGSAFKHTSNSTHNTKFPFDMTAGGSFTVLNC